MLKRAATIVLTAGLTIGTFAVPASALSGAAKTLDAATQSGGPTAAQNQKIQELTFAPSASAAPASGGADGAGDADSAGGGADAGAPMSLGALLALVGSVIHEIR